MKKTVIAILSVVLVLSLSMVALVACNKDEAKASNSEVLGTAVAGAAQSAMGNASSSATENTEDDFKAGVNLTVGNSAIDLAASASVKGIGAAVQPVLEKTISQVDKFLGENGIKVEKVASDREGYTDKLAISGTYVDEETGDSKTYEYALYVGVQGGDGIDDDEVDGVALGKHVDDLHGLFAIVRLGKDQVGDVDTKMLGIVWVDGVFGIDVGCSSTLLLDFGDGF